MNSASHHSRLQNAFKKVLLSLTKFVPHLTILYGCDFDNDGHCHWDQSRIAKLF